MFEIFDWTTGDTLRTVRWGWTARLLIRLSSHPYLDYIEAGTDW